MAGNALIAQTSDQGNAAIAGASAHLLALGTGAPYTVPSGTWEMLVGLMVNVGSGGSPVMPNARGVSMNAAQVDSTTGLFTTSRQYCATNGTSLGATAPAGPLTLTVNANLPYIGAN